MLNSSNEREDQAKGDGLSLPIFKKKYCCLVLNLTIIVVLFFFKLSGVAKVQVVADENTDPTSLYLSNCSVDSTVLGWFWVFFFYSLHRAVVDIPTGNTA